MNEDIKWIDVEDLLPKKKTECWVLHDGKVKTATFHPKLSCFVMIADEKTPCGTGGYVSHWAEIS